MTNARFMLRLLFSSLLSIYLLAAPAQNSTALERIFQEIERVEEETSADGLRGRHPETFPFTTSEQIIARAEAFRDLRAELRALPEDKLSRQEAISRSIMLGRLENHLSYVRFKAYLMPFNAEGGFFTRPVYFLPNLPFDTQADYEAYLAWLPSFADYLAYQQQQLAEGIGQQVMRPEVIVRNAIGQLQPFTEPDLDQNPFGVPLLRLPASRRDELQTRARTILVEHIVPAYRELLRFFREEYLPVCPRRPGIDGIANGRAYYEDRIRHFTTLDLTPDSVYRLGLREVERIDRRMRQLIEELDFEGDFADFLAFLRTDPRFYVERPEELLRHAAWLSKQAEGQLPKYFARLYELPFTVEPVPEAIAPTYTGGRYVPGNQEQGRAGIYWVNTYDLPSRPLYTLPALTLHEAVPGHHLGMMRAAELDGLPDFRRRHYISAYGEGWGLYAEFLGEEMGMYATPYDLFGRYTYEMWRACRLVVDVGLHYKGWSRQQALDYLAEHTALSMQEVRTEIDRYIGWPGQAVSYKIGEITIKQLRAEAEARLGDAFDIRSFHEAVLRNGSVPLPVLRQEVQAYWQEAKSQD